MRVPVPDRPGVLADVTTLAAELDVNIADLEIAHSSEGDRGVLILLVPGRSGRALPRRRCSARGYRPAVRTARMTAVRRDRAARSTARRHRHVPGSKSITNRALVLRGARRRHESCSTARCGPTTPTPWSTACAARRRDRRRRVTAHHRRTGTAASIPATEASSTSGCRARRRASSPRSLARGRGRYDDRRGAADAPSADGPDVRGRCARSACDGRRAAASPACLPVVITSARRAAVAAVIGVAATCRASSCRGLLLAGVCDGSTSSTALVSAPYVDMTAARCARSGSRSTPVRVALPASSPTPSSRRVAAVLLRGRGDLRVAGCTSPVSRRSSLQGDLRLRRRARVGWAPRSSRATASGIEVRGTRHAARHRRRPARPLRHGADARRRRRVRRRPDDDHAASGFIRGKETDRIAAIVAASCGAAASRPPSTPTGSPSSPAAPQPARDRDLRRSPHGDGVRAARAARRPASRSTTRTAWPRRFPATSRRSTSFGNVPAPMRVIAIDGPAGSGKSTVARRAGRAARPRVPRHRRDVPRRRVRRPATRHRSRRRRAGRPRSSATSTLDVSLDARHRRRRRRHRRDPRPGGHPRREHRRRQPRGARRAASTASASGRTPTAGE